MTNAAVAACASDKIDVAGDGSNCVDSKFELTTTSLSASDTFKFAISAEGTFYVDCGDGGTLSGTGTSGKTISKSTNFSVSYTCTWTTAGSHKIKFGGAATEYSIVGLDVTSDNAAITFYTTISNNAVKIASVSGSLAAIFPQLGSSASQIPQFIDTFRGATNLTSLPSTLFSGGNLTGGSNAKYMFYKTFGDCTGLTAIPAGLFADVTSAANSMFYKTFDGCTSLGGFIPSTAFAGLVANSSPTATSMWNDTFNGTQLLTSCPSGTTQFTTQYESNWDGKVSCNCTGANYYDGTSGTCTACPAGYTSNTNNGKTDASQCQISCAAGTFVATPATVGSTDYTRLEYIENPNGKYIDTGFKHNPNATTIRGVLRVGVSSNLANNKNVNFIGNQVSKSGGYSLGWNAYFKLWTEATNNRLNGPAYPMTAGTVHEVEYTVTNTSRALAYGTGETASDTIKNGKVITNHTIHIYDAGNHQSDRQFTGRIYDLQVYEDGVLVHNFVAARRNQGGVVGMYDIVTDTFLTGTGTFTAGPDAGACSNVGVGFYSNASLTNYGSVSSRIKCTNGGAHTQYTGSAASNSCPYVCDTNYVMENGVCEFQDKFTLTTTSDTTELLFDISAIGTFYVDCGTDGVLTQTEYDSGNNAAGSVIIRTTTTKRIYSCAWPSAGVHTVKFAGVATSYSTDAATPAISFYHSSGTNTSNKIASISGTLATIFPQKGTANGKFPRFYRTFRGATNLTSIPAGLFTGLNPGADATSMFYQTFYGCSGLTTIPAGLFASVTTGATEMFRETFSTCTSLTAIPSDLFSNITTAASGLFRATFKGATNLSSYIPTTTFAGLISNNSPTATDMWTETFSNTNVSTTCPVGMDEYPSGYESEWAPKVSCYVACPNDPPANSKWSIINGVCQWLCDEMYYSANGTSCTAVEDGYYSAEGENTRTACTNKPSNSHYTGPAATDNCPWQCDTGYGSDNGQCHACTASEFWADGNCETTKFTITTTNSTSEFKFFMWEPTGTFYVDWGDGTADTITRTSSTGNTYSHTYSTAGSYTINFGGVATGYDGNSAHTTISFYAQSSGTQDKIASVSGSLVSLFPTPNNSALPYFRETFKGATNLSSVPNTLFSGLTRTQSHMFYHTFDGSGLTTIPYDLFDDVNTLGPGMFEYTFANCASLTAIPSGLFDGMTASGSAGNMFEGTFAGCTSLATIPPDLFEDVISNAANGTDESGWFKDTFNGCTSLATIPSGLFSDITDAAENLFSGTFYGCTNLSGYIPPSTFAGLISNNSPTDTDMWLNTFVGTNLATMCPAGTTQYITHYEGSTNGTTWNGKVSCEPCAAGTYKASAGNTACIACEIGTYATGGASSCTDCTNTIPANSVYSSNATTNACLWSCGAGYYSTDSASCTAVGVGYYSAAGDNTRSACVSGLTTIGYGHGADEANDCGHALNVGGYTIYTRGNKITTPSLNFKLSDNSLFYISTSSSDHTLSPLHLGDGTAMYTAYDDSLLYDERPAAQGGE